MSLKFSISFLTGFLFILSLGLISCSESGDYISSIEKYRIEKDIWLSNDFESPFLKKNTPFNRLSYFEINEDLKIEAEIVRSSEKDSIKLVTNTGEVRSFFIIGQARFKINGNEVSLDLLTEDNSNLFIPFADQTSGKSTYGGGRYLELKIPNADEVVLDFNLAFNPYCAYVEGYSCPLPPKANVLKVEIKAGEKKYIP